MDLRLRRFYLFTTVLIFIIAAPLIVFYARGWRYDTTLHRIVQTGSLTVTSSPGGVEILLDGSLISSTPLKAKRIAPGTYALALRKEGWIAREQSISVAKGEATVLEDIQLIKDDPQPLRMLEGNVVMMEASPDASRRIAVIQNEGDFSVFFNEDPLGNFELARVVSQRPLTAAWSSDQSSALVTLEKTSGGVPAYLVVTAAGSDYVTAGPGEELRNVFWDSARGSTLWLWADQTLRESGTGSAYQIPIELTPLLVTRDTVYAVRTDASGRTLVVYSPETGNERQLESRSVSPRMAASFVGPYLTFTDLESHTVSFIKKVGDQYVSIRNREPVITVSWSQEAELLMVLDTYALSLMDDAHFQTYVRYSTPISSAAWFPGRSMVLFVHEGDVYSLDASQRTALVSRVYDLDARMLAMEKNGGYLFIADERGILRLRVGL